MAATTVTCSKFIGTISLGLLTGTSYTLSTLTLPPLLALPTSTPAHSTFTHLRQSTSRHHLLLSTLSSSSLFLAYILSPPRRRHPFLLYAIAAIGSAYARDIWTGTLHLLNIGSSKKSENGGVGGAKAGKAERESSESSGDEEWEVANAASQADLKEGGLNGEVVREGMEKWRGIMLGRTAVWGIGWVVMLVGLWGDGVVV